MATSNTIITVPGTISPKVYAPVAALLALGLVLILLGIAVDEKQLKDIGYGVLAAAVPAAIAGWKASPGQTMTVADPARAPITDDGAGPDPHGEAGYVNLSVLSILLVVVGIVLFFALDSMVWLVLVVLALVLLIVAESRGPRTRI